MPENDLHEQIASELLTPLWKGIPSEYKAKYARNIWGQFEDNIRSAAYCDRLSKFLDKLTQRLGIAVMEVDAGRITEFLAAADTRQTLKALREDTALLVLLVRAANEERREAFKAREGKKAVKAEGKSALDSLKEYEARESTGSLFEEVQ
mgnify:CR=1 FL=1